MAEQRRGRSRRTYFRKHLVKKINSSAQDVVLLMSPIGYGKTTVLKQVEILSPNPVFLELSVDDANPISFIDHLVEGLKNKAGLLLAEFRSEDAWLDRVALVLDVLDRSVKDIQIFLDGSQVFNESTAKVLEQLLDGMPNGHRCYLAGHSSSNLKLSKLYGQARVLTLGQKDFEFGTEEVLDCLAEFESSLTVSDVLEFSRGMALMIFMFISTNSKSTMPLEDMIFENTLQLSDDLQKVLPNLAVLEIWDDASIEALEVKMPKDWFSQLAASGLPINVISETERQLQPHHLLRDYLMEFLKKNSEEFRLINLLHAQLCVSKELHISAIRGFLNAQELELAREHALKTAISVMQFDDYQTGLQVLEEFQNEDLLPRMNLLKIKCMLNCGHLVEAGKLLLQFLESPEYEPLKRLANLNYIFYLRLTNQYLAATNHCRKIRDWFEKPHPLLRFLLVEEAHSTYELQRYQQHLLLIDELIDECEVDPEDSDILQMSGMSHMALGKFELGFQKFKSLETLLEKSRDFRTLSEIQNWLAMFCALSNDAESARDYIEKALESSRRSMSMQFPYFLSTYAEIESMFGNTTSSIENYQQAINLLKLSGSDTVLEELHLLDLKFYLGDIGIDIVKNHLLKIKPVNPTQYSVFALFSAKIAFVEGESVETIEFAKFASQHSWTYIQMRAYSFLIAAMFRTNHVQFEATLKDFTKRIQFIGSLRFLFIDWDILKEVFSELIATHKLGKNLIIPPEMPIVHNRKPRLEIQSLGRYRVKVDGEDIIISNDKSFEYMVYIAIFKEKAIDEILNDFFNGDRSKRTNLDYYVSRLRQDFIRVFPNIDKKQLFPYDKNKKAYMFGENFRVFVDAKAIIESFGAKLLQSYRGKFLMRSEYPWAESFATNLEHLFLERAHAYAKSVENLNERVAVYEAMLYSNPFDEVAWHGCFAAFVDNKRVHDAKDFWNRWSKFTHQHGLPRPEEGLLKSLDYLQ